MISWLCLFTLSNIYTYFSSAYNSWQIIMFLYLRDIRRYWWVTISPFEHFVVSLCKAWVWSMLSWQRLIRGRSWHLDCSYRWMKIWLLSQQPQVLLPMIDVWSRSSYNEILSADMGLPQSVVCCSLLFDIFQLWPSIFVSVKLYYFISWIPPQRSGIITPIPSPITAPDESTTPPLSVLLLCTRRS